MKNKELKIITALMIGTMTILAGGCGNQVTAPETVHEEETKEKTEKDNTESTEGSADADKEQGENSDDGDASKTEPASLYFLTKDMSIEEKLENYAVNLQKPDYTGDIGEVIPAYKNVDLNGDGSADIIERYGDESGCYGYRICFSDGGTIETGVYSSSPNEGEVIEFCDMDHDHTDEILITHCTFGTAGPFCWHTYLYVRNDKGDWWGFPVRDEENKIYPKELTEWIRECSGKTDYDRSIRIADIQLTDDGIALLVDFGEKDGPDQWISYEGVLVSPNLEKIKQGVSSDEEALTFAESSWDNVEKYWPVDAEAVADDEEETIPEYLVYVNAPDGYANLRTGPGTEYEVICQIPNGDSMEVYRTDATAENGKKWLKVAYYNVDSWVTGWIAESQLE